MLQRLNQIKSNESLVDELPSIVNVLGRFL